MTLRGMFIFTCGALAGGIATSMVMRHKYENKLREEVKVSEQKVHEMEEYVRKVKEAYRPKYAPDEMEKTDEAASEEKTPKEKVNYKDFYKQNEEVLAKLLAGGTKPVSQDWLDPADREHPEDDAPEEEGMEEVRVTRTMKRPCELITSWDYDDIDGYDRTELVYFTEDDVLAVEDRYEIIEDPVAFVDNFLDEWKKNDEEEELFVKNYRRQTLYYIRKEFGKYY